MQIEAGSVARVCAEAEVSIAPVFLFRSSVRPIAAAGALAVMASACGGKSTAEPAAEAEPTSEAVPTVCVAATRGPLDRIVDVRGRVATQPGGSLPVESLIAGYVVEVRVTEGASVKKGAVVAIVDDLAPRSAATQAQAAVARSIAVKAQTGAALERAKKLQTEGIISKADLDVAQANDDAAKSDLAAQEAAQGLATGTLTRVEVRSSFDGIVTKILRGAGAVVDGVNGANPTPILEIEADNALEFTGDATERDLDLLAAGESADVTLSSSAAALRGEVIAVPRDLDTKSGLGTVRIVLVPPANRAFDGVRIGAFGHARIHGRTIADAVSIPRAALRGAVLDGAEVAVCDGAKASVRKITVGYRDNDRVEVTSGLKAGERVAIGDVLGLTDGTSIAPAEASAAASAEAHDSP